MKTAIIQSSQLGVNCWSAKRFCGGRCDRVMSCKYPERLNCKAVESEKEYIEAHYQTQLNQLKQSHDSTLTFLQDNSKPIHVYTITQSDVKDVFNKQLQGSRDPFKLLQTMGKLLPNDIGKRVYLHPSGIYQVESDGQLKKRLNKG